MLLYHIKSFEDVGDERKRVLCDIAACDSHRRAIHSNFSATVPLYVFVSGHDEFTIIR